MTVYSIFTYVGIAALLLTALRFWIARPKNWLICYLQNFIGALFIFSGFVKAVDPLGTSYKMHEYFEAFAQEGLRPVWEYLATWSTSMSILMIAAELFFGFTLLIGWMPRFTVTIVWWLTLFFTILTGYTYLSGYCITTLFVALSTAAVVMLAAVPLISKVNIRNLTLLAGLLFVAALFFWFKSESFGCAFTETKMKVTDCGCFGDFIKLKPWETFYKDVFLDALILILVLGYKDITSVFSKATETFAMTGAALFSSIICLYHVYWNEPSIDFRPYKVGNNIAELRKEVKPAVIEMTFVYKNKKTGEQMAYTMNELTSLNYDEVEFVERKDVVKDPGIPAKISNLFIEDNEGQNITDAILSEPGYTFLVVSPNIGKINEEAFKALNAIAEAATKSGAKFYAVVRNEGNMEQFKKKVNATYPFYHADETPLKTMIRSNPGLLLLKEGVVVNKWHYRHLPTVGELQKIYFNNN